MFYPETSRHRLSIVQEYEDRAGFRPAGYWLSQITRPSSSPGPAIFYIHLWTGVFGNPPGNWCHLGNRTGRPLEWFWQSLQQLSGLQVSAGAHSCSWHLSRPMPVNNASHLHHHSPFRHTPWFLRLLKTLRITYFFYRTGAEQSWMHRYTICKHHRIIKKKPKKSSIPKPEPVARDAEKRMSHLIKTSYSLIPTPSFRSTVILIFSSILTVNTSSLS